MKATEDLVNIKINKLVHGGQGLGELSNGKKAFVWNALPGEQVLARIIKNRSSHVDAIACQILTAANNRIDPKEPDVYLATSPWQMLDYSSELKYKSQIISETFLRENIELPEFKFKTDDILYHYRNKMEYSFYGDDSGVHLALYNRGSHQKQIVSGSALARPEIDLAAAQILQILNHKSIRASDLKSLILRCSQQSVVIASLFVKTETFPKLEVSSHLAGLTVFYSNPKSPASVATKLLQQTGQHILNDRISDKDLSYDAQSFFQVNVPVFSKTITSIAKFTTGDDQIVDIYCGVGSIGLSLKSKNLSLIDISADNIYYAKLNASNDVTIVEASSEKVLDNITAKSTVIVDPPRSGLHPKLINHLLITKPSKIIYLSCNPSTQARDIALLKDQYKIVFFEGYNFFPRTPHIETLAVLIAE